MASTKSECRKWALEIAAHLVITDAENMRLVDLDLDADEERRRRDALRQVALELKRKAERINAKTIN